MVRIAGIFLQEFREVNRPISDPLLSLIPAQGMNESLDLAAGVVIC